MGNKGNKATTTQTQSYTANPITLGGASQAMGMAENAVNNAQFTPDQLAAFQSIRNLQGGPYQQYGLQYLLQSGSPLDQPDIDKYLNPYADYVRRNLQEVFGQQMRDTTGKLTQQAGGVGADRIAVGQAELARQQDLAAGQTMAGIYQNALTAAEQEKQRQYLTAMGMPGLQSSDLQAIQAQAGAGAQQQALPLQLAQFLASITGGLSGALGGTTSGVSQTVGPTPSALNQILGVGTSALGAKGALGGGGSSYVPWGSSPSYGGGNIFSGDAYGGSSSNPLPGLTAADYGTGYAEGGEVDDGADISLVKAPNENIPTAWMPGAGGNHPALNMSSPSGGGGGGSSTTGDVAKIAQAAATILPMFLNHGGRIPHAAFGGPYMPPNFHRNPIRVNPYLHHAGPSGSEIFHSMMPDGMEAPAYRYARRAGGGTVNPWDTAQGFQEGGSPFTSRFDAISPDLPPSYLPQPGLPPSPFTPSAGLNPSGAGNLPIARSPQQWFLPPPTAGKVNWPAPLAPAGGWTQPDTEVADDEPDIAISSANRNPYSPATSGSINEDLTEESMRMPKDQIPYPDALNRDAGQNIARSPWLAMINAGAKMAQTVGPVGSAIGAGIQAGVGELSNQRKELRNEQLINQKAEELHRHAIQELNKYQRKTPHELAVETEQQRYHDILSGLSGQRIEQGNRRLEQPNYFVAGVDREGNAVLADRRTGTLLQPDVQFTPSKSYTSVMANAQWMVDNGIAPDTKSAFDMLHQGVNTPAVYSRLVQAEKNLLLKTPEGPAMSPEKLEATARANVEARFNQTNPAASQTAPKVGDRKQFKQGWGTWNGTAWVPDKT